MKQRIQCLTAAVVLLVMIVPGPWTMAGVQASAALPERSPACQIANTQDALDWKRVETSYNITPRQDHAMAYDSARLVTVLFYGLSTYEWDGVNWTKLYPPGHSLVQYGTRWPTIARVG